MPSFLPATGRQIEWNVGIERRFMEPSLVAQIGYDPILPIKAGMIPAEVEGPQVNRLSLLTKGVPIEKVGDLEFTFPLTVDNLLEYFFNVYGDATKNVLQAGAVWEYVFTNPALDNFVDFSFYGIAGMPPVVRWINYGMKFASVEITIAAGQVVPCKLVGSQAHSTKMSLATPDAGNTGTYVGLPYLRGPLAVPTGDADEVISISISRDVAGGGVQFKVFHGSEAVEAFTGAAVDLLLDSDGNALWQNLQNQAGADLGYYAENKDPLEIIFPGVAAGTPNLSLLAIGDIFRFYPTGWALPSIASAVSANRFTRAHYLVEYREAGSVDPYITTRADTGAIKIENPLSVETGGGSKYPHSIRRVGPVKPYVSFTRSFVDQVLMDYFEKHQRLDLRVSFIGQQLGDLSDREKFQLVMPSAGLKQGAPVSGADIVVETVELTGETDDSGNPSSTLTVNSTRDWTIPTVP